MPGGNNEAFSRVLIDKALEFSGWNLLDPHQVRFELHGGTGRADYGRYKPVTTEAVNHGDSLTRPSPL